MQNLKRTRKERGTGTATATATATGSPQGGTPTWPADSTGLWLLSLPVDTLTAAVAADTHRAWDHGHGHATAMTATPNDSHNGNSNGIPPYRPLLAYDCLIIPVFFGIWWYWVRRKANAVLQKLMVTNRPDPAEDEDSATPAQQQYYHGGRRSKPDGRDRPWDHDTFSTWCVSGVFVRSGFLL